MRRRWSRSYASAGVGRVTPTHRCRFLLSHNLLLRSEMRLGAELPDIVAEGEHVVIELNLLKNFSLLPSGVAITL
jgi:hypothetical protein